MQEAREERNREEVIQEEKQSTPIRDYQREHAEMDLGEEGGADVGVPELQRCRPLIQGDSR